MWTRRQIILGTSLNLHLSVLGTRLSSSLIKSHAKDAAVCSGGRLQEILSGNKERQRLAAFTFVLPRTFDIKRCIYLATYSHDIPVLTM